jgi:hypothetical protein
MNIQSWARFESNAPSTIRMPSPQFFGDDARFIASIADYFNTRLPPHLLDLRNIVRAMYREDCRIRRGANWKRQLFVSVEVSSPEFWNQLEVRSALDAVGACTGDEWLFDFAASSVSKDVVASGPLDLNMDPVGMRAFLASEGADSVCGLTLRLSESVDTRYFGVNGITQYCRASQLDKSLRLLNKTDRKGRLALLSVPLQIPPEKRFRVIEGSQRTRSFVLLVTGAIGSLLTRDTTLEIYENGIESFNLPLEPTLHAECYSRAMYPVVVERMRKLLEFVTGGPFTILMPYLFWTKAEMAAEAARVGSPALVLSTVSCVHFPSRMRGPRQCGVCEGCVLRRMGFAHAGIVEPSGSYRHDFVNGPDSGTRHPYLVRLQMQIHHLRRDVLAMPSHELAVSALLRMSGLPFGARPELISAAAKLTQSTEHVSCGKILGMYERFLKEWDHIAPPRLAAANLHSSDEGVTTKDRVFANVG